MKKGIESRIVAICFIMLMALISSPIHAAGIDEVDLALDKTVYNAVPKVGGESVFTITVTNLSGDVAATNVEIEDILDANLVYKHSSTAHGSYDPGTGIWSIPTILPGQTVSLEIMVTVNGSADNMARLLDLDQDDINIKNDYGYASVTVSGSSGGNDGGIESDGSMAGKIAVRHFSRLKDPTVERLQKPAEMITFDEDLARNGLIKPVSILKGQTDLAELFPEAGPYNSTAFVSTPSDIIGISNAQEVFSVDYFDQTQRRMAAVLAMTTDNGEVYNHTKMVCDRLNGATLDKLNTILIGDHLFVMGKLVQDNGDIDYTISFITYEQGGKMVVDNRWLNQDYSPANTTVFNFQVWSVTPQSTVELVESILDRLGQDNELRIKNAAQPDVPDTYVVNGYYDHGAIVVNLHAGEGVEQITVRGKLNRHETGSSETFEATVPVQAGQGDYQTIEIPTGFVYDVEFSLSNTSNDSRDRLYFADGTWGKYIEESAAIVDRFETTSHDGSILTDAYQVERNALISGQVKTYASLFRSLRPGNLSVDLSGYNTLEFEASGMGEIELIVAKQSIDNWGDQFRTMISLEPGEKTYSIDLSTLHSPKYDLFTTDDVVSVSFNALGDGVNYSDFEMEIKSMRFVKGTNNQGFFDGNELGLSVYPNPVQFYGTLEFMMPLDGPARIALYDITGKEVRELANNQFSQGIHTLRFSTVDTEDGMYFIKIFWNNQVETKRISVIR